MIPGFLDMPFRANTFIMDPVNAVTTLIAALRTELLALNWTEPIANTFQTPARSDGMGFTVAVAAATAIQATYIVKDLLGRQVNTDTLTRQNIPAGSTVQIYSGDRYLWIDRTGGGTVWGCGVLDREPDSISDPYPVYYATRGPVMNDNGTGYQNWYEMYIAANSAGGTANTALISWQAPSTTQSDHFTVQGSMILALAEYAYTTPPYWLFGRLPNAVMLDSSQPGGFTCTIPIDDVTMATFRVLSAGGTVVFWKLAVRIA
jgi:hypothetical protein